MRWLHEGVDVLYVALMQRIVPPLFRDGGASPALREHLQAVDLQMPALAGNGRYSVGAHTLVGDVEAGFRLRLGPSPAAPVVIFHHGLGEIPFDHTFRRIFRRRIPVDAHLVALRAPFHRSYIDCCRGLATLGQFLAMCAVSVRLIEAVRLVFVAGGAQASLVAGISLGGFAALLHHLTYGTATRYAPQLAGPDLAHTLLATPCRRLLSRDARIDPAELTGRLDFRRAFRASDARRVSALLGRYDLWMPLDHHEAVYAASGVPVTIIDRGHMTGSWAFARLRAHLLAQLRELDGTGEAGKAVARSR